MSQHDNAWWAIYREKNRLRFRAYSKKYKRQEKYLKSQREWYAENIDRERVKRMANNKKRRAEIIEFMGAKCVQCNFSDARALQIDHVNSDGNKDRKTFGHSASSLQRRVIEDMAKGENKYQLLCANCNWIKRYEKNELSWDKRIKV